MHQQLADFSEHTDYSMVVYQLRLTFYIIMLF